MTGRDLIMYILSNGLENEPVFKDGAFVGLLTIEQAAIKLDTGVESIRGLYVLGMITGVIIGGELYILDDAKINERSKSNNE